MYDEDNTDAVPDNGHTSRSDTNAEPKAVMPTTQDMDSLPPVSLAIRTPLPDDDHLGSQPTQPVFKEITTDLES